MKSLVMGTQLVQRVVRFKLRSVFLLEAKYFHCKGELAPKQLASGGREWAT